MRILRYVFCVCLFATASFADTININWVNGDTTYTQTTCTVGGDIVLPQTPTKRGYSFDGWDIIKYNQLIQNGNFAETDTISSDDSTGYIGWRWYGSKGNIFTTENELIINGGILRTKNISVADASHIYFVSFRAKGTSGTNFYIPLLGGTPCKLTDSYKDYDYIQTPIQKSVLVQFNVDDGIVQIDKQKGIVWFDLTEMFGAGEEPTTIEEAKARIAEFYGQELGYYPYKPL